MPLAKLLRGFGRCGLLTGATWAWFGAAQALWPAQWGQALDSSLLLLTSALWVLGLASALAQEEESSSQDRQLLGSAHRWSRSLAPLGDAFRKDIFRRPKIWLFVVVLPLFAWGAVLRDVAVPWQLMLLSLALVSPFVGSRSPAITRHPAWSLATLALSLGICFTYLACGKQLLGSSNNDAAYYYGVARHIAETGRFEEPIVWHHLIRPPEVTHAPFDYWPALPSLSLVPIFAIFGSSPHVLGLAAASVSCVSVLLFWFLICVQRPVQSAWLQVVGVLLFAFSPPLLNYRFDAETVPWSHVWILASLIFLSRRRLRAAVVCGFVLFLSRPDCIGLTAVVWAVALLLAVETGRLRVFSALVFALVGAYVGHHLLVFGSVTPPGSGLALRVIDGMELYRFRAEGALLTPLGDRFTTAFFDDRVHIALEALRTAHFVPLFHLWFFLALAGGARRHFRADLGAKAAWLMLPVGTMLPSLLSPAVFAPWRTLHVLLPVLLLVGCHALDACLSAIKTPQLESTRFFRLRSGLAAALACGFALVVCVDLRPYLKPPAPPTQALGPKVLAQYLDGEPVMSLFPWFVLSVSKSPAVGLPSNGEQAVLAAISHYKARWLMIPTTGVCQEQTTVFCRELIHLGKTQFEPFQFSPVATGGGMRLFKIEPLPPLLREPASRVTRAQEVKGSPGSLAQTLSREGAACPEMWRPVARNGAPSRLACERESVVAR